MSNHITKQGVLSRAVKEGAGGAIRPGTGQFRCGAVLLKACDERLGLSAAMALCLRDARQQGKVDHSYQEIFQQRMFGIACGYADGNDAARIGDDPVFKLLTGRDPVTGSALASQPTLSRFENAVHSGDLLQMSEALADAVIQRHDGANAR